MYGNGKSMFGNKPMQTALSATTKSAMEKVGPVAIARPTAPLELGSAERGGMQYVPSLKTSVAPARYKY